MNPQITINIGAAGQPTTGGAQDQSALPSPGMYSAGQSSSGAASAQVEALPSPMSQFGDAGRGLPSSGDLPSPLGQTRGGDASTAGDLPRPTDAQARGGTSAESSAGLPSPMPIEQLRALAGKQTGAGTEQDLPRPSASVPQSAAPGSSPGEFPEPEEDKASKRSRK